MNVVPQSQAHEGGHSRVTAVPAVTLPQLRRIPQLFPRFLVVRRAAGASSAVGARALRAPREFFGVLMAQKADFFEKLELGKFQDRSLLINPNLRK